MAVLISDPTTWPLGDVLPLTRPTEGDWPELGVVLSQPAFTVYLANAFEPGLTRRLAGCERIEYVSADAISEAGWRVD